MENLGKKKTKTLPFSGDGIELGFFFVKKKGVPPERVWGSWTPKGFFFEITYHGPRENLFQINPNIRGSKWGFKRGGG